MNALKKILNIIFVVLIISMLLLIILTITNKYNISIGNYKIFNVASGSMEPTLKVGDYILIKKHQNYKIGDIVTYRSNENYITHRIVEINNNEIITKGDANSSKDEPITTSNITGKFIMKLTLFNFVYNKYFIGSLIAIAIIINIDKLLMKKRKGRYYEKIK